MITLKQLEALLWIAELGTFERAAANMSHAADRIGAVASGQRAAPRWRDHARCR